MIVQKFGGSSLADAAGFQACAALISEGAADQSRVAVLSAVYGVTNLLEQAIVAAVAGEPLAAVDEIAAREGAVVRGLASAGVPSAPLEALLESRLARLRERLQGVQLLGNCPPQSRAEILASGEAFSSRTMVLLLQHRGVEAAWSDTGVLPPADGDWLDSLVDIPAARERLLAALQQGPPVLVLPGFYVRNAHDQVQLLGRNGSDYSAAAVAAAIGASRCQIWKDVDGFFTADPAVVSNARCLPEVSYEEAMELSFYGAQVISAKALAPLAAARIPCEIRNTFDPQHAGTLVHGEVAQQAPVRGISLLDHVAVINISGSGMRGRVGIAQRVMGALAARSISVLVIVQSSSEYSITLSVHAQQAEAARQALEAELHFERLHQLINDISVQQERAVISLVGSGMKHNRGMAARFLTAVSSAGVNVEVIAQGASECAIALVVERSEAVAAVRASHTAFFSQVGHIDVVLLGCGNVGSALLAQFHRQREVLAGRGQQLSVRAIANSRRLLVADDEIDLAQWQQQLEAEGQAYRQEDLLAIRQRLGLLNPTIVDCTTNETLAGQYTTFLANGFNVVAANKKANTGSLEYYHAMRDTAARNFRKFLYETNVGAGLPVIDTLHALMRSGDELISFQGILSGSLSMIFGLLEDGQSFSSAVQKAMALGYTEPDPRDDLSGMDVARKLLIIAREVGLDLELADITVVPVIEEGFAADAPAKELPEHLKALDQAFAERIAEAQAQGAVLRYVGRIEQGACQVSIDAVPVSQPLGAIRDGENALVLHTRYYQPLPLVLRGYGAGAEVTAAGVFADVLRTAWRPLDQ